MSADPRKLAMDCKRICLGFEMLASRAMASEGLSVSQAMILMFVLRNSEKGTSLTAIHRQFGYSMASLSSTIKRLKSNGYIRVEPCPSDDRLKLLFCTGKGRELEKYLMGSIDRVCGRLYGGLSDDELSQLEGLQQRVLCRLTGGEETVQ